MSQYQDDDGIRIAFSSIQLAAVLVDETISAESSITNRLWGGLRTVGGVIEMAGAGVLCAAPDPTLTTKVGCVVVGAHGSDTLSTGLRQVWSGRTEKSLTEHAASATAQTLGADLKTAQTIGLTVDIAVPVIFAAWVGAARVASVHSGRINLFKHEAQPGSRLGGHAIERHIGKTEADLRARLAAQPRIPAASSFSSLDVAERAISQALRVHKASIQYWAKSARHGQTYPIDYNVGSIIGHSVVRSSGRLVNTTKIRIVLKLEMYNNMPYYILTAFPIP